MLARIRRCWSVAALLTVLLCALQSVAWCQDISLAGDLTLTLRRDGLNYAVSKGAESWVLELDGSKARVLNSGTTVARGSRTANTVTLSDASDNPRYVVSMDGEEYTVSENGAKLCRVKIKDDKFNIYDAGNQRTLHGKQKEGSWRLKRESGDDALRLSGPGSLREASFLSVPLPAEYRVLLWGLAR